MLSTRSSRGLLCNCTTSPINGLQHWNKQIVIVLSVAQLCGEDDVRGRHPIMNVTSLLSLCCCGTWSNNKLSRVTCHCHAYHVYFSGRGGREGDGLDQESICSTGSRGEQGSNRENIVIIDVKIRASNEGTRRLREVLQSRRMPLLGPFPAWKQILALSHLRHY